MKDHATIWLMVLCTMVLSAGQFMLKRGAKSAGLEMLLEPYVVAGFLLLCAAGVMMTIALKHGELSALYPIIALGFVWVAIVSALFLGEQPQAHQIIGTIAIIFGVSLIGHGGRR